MLCVNPFLSEGWFVWGLGEWFALVGCGEEYLWGRKFLLNLQTVDLQLHWACQFSAGVFHTFAEADYLPGFCVDWCPGEKGLIVTWRQILNLTWLEKACIWETVSIHMSVCIYAWRGHACLCACGCSHVHLCACVIIIFNCILTIACTCA